MKKLGIIFAILALIAGGVFGYMFYKDYKYQARVKEIKKGWYVEVLNESVKIRKEADRNTAILGEAKKGEVYKVFDMEIKDVNFWYQIEYEKGKKGWIANPNKTEYLDDVNNPSDIKAPSIKFDSICYVQSIEEISLDSCGVIISDDRDVSEVKVTYEVFHELNELDNKDQYWIQYIATDLSGKSAKKVQKIVFSKRPSEKDVSDFEDLVR